MKNFEIFDADIQLFTFHEKFIDIFPHFFVFVKNQLNYINATLMFSNFSEFARGENNCIIISPLLLFTFYQKAGMYE